MYRQQKGLIFIVAGFFLVSIVACSPIPTAASTTTITITSIPASATPVPPTITPEPTATTTPIPLVGGFIIQNGQLMELKGTEWVSSPFLEGVIPAKLKLGTDGTIVEAYDENDGLIALWDGARWSRIYANWQAAAQDVLTTFEKEHGSLKELAMKTGFGGGGSSNIDPPMPLVVSVNGLLIGYAQTNTGLTLFYANEAATSEKFEIVPLQVSFGLNGKSGVVPILTGESVNPSMSYSELLQNLDAHIGELLTYTYFLRFKSAGDVCKWGNGDVFWFYHFDTDVSKSYRESVEKTCSNKQSYLYRFSADPGLLKDVSIRLSKGESFPQNPVALLPLLTDSDQGGFIAVGIQFDVDPYLK